MKTGILLINLGSPDAPTAQKVRPYLRQFLSDPRVLDINPVVRTLILNLFILPFRPAKSAHAYSQIWTKEGSPLINYGKSLTKKVQSILDQSEPNRYSVKLAMRYGNPSIEKAIKEFDKEGIIDITVLPLFPQYASASTGSAVEEVYRVSSKLWNIPHIKVVDPFYNNDKFISNFAETFTSQTTGKSFDHYLFSYHGLPERHVKKSDLTQGKFCLQSDNCCSKMTFENQHCYRAQCFETTRLLAEKLNIPKEKWSISFQSRLGSDPWIKPWTDEVIVDLPKKGIKSLAIFSAAFVADCLETLEEIGIRAKEDFIKAGGEGCQLIYSLNDNDSWAETVAELTTKS